MSLTFATQLTAVATAVLAVFAIVTAFYARQAFRKQSQEVSAIERQVKDQQELTRQQAELLKIQSGRLELQGQQLDDQRKVNAGQAEVLKLQADDLRESLAARQRAAEGAGIQGVRSGSRGVVPPAQRSSSRPLRSRSCGE